MTPAAGGPPPQLTPDAARRVFLVLTATRWLPVGLVVGIFTLVARERGLSIEQITLYAAAQGVMVLLLELPTSGFADVLGRRPVLLVAGVVNVLAGLAYLVAQSFWQFAFAAALMGVYRALDSGPLEAWFVDVVHESEPDADLNPAMSAQGVLVGIGLGGGALLSAGLIAWHPIGSQSALVLPVLVFVALTVLHLVATLVLLREAPRVSGRALERATASVRGTPAVVADGLRLVRHNRVLTGLVALELFWVTAMMAYETLMPLRLAELLGSEARAGLWMGPAAAGGWALFSVGSWIAGRLAPRIGVVWTAIAARVLNGLGVVGIGLAAGPVAMVLAYLVTYSLHGLGGPVHLTLLHGEASARNRATILSINSLVMQVGGAVAGPLLGLLAARTSLATAMVVAGAVSIVGVVCYVPALRAHRRLGSVDLPDPSDPCTSAEPTHPSARPITPCSSEQPARPSSCGVERPGHADSHD